VLRRLRAVVVLVVLALLATTAVRLWVVDLAVVPSASMEPTLHPGDRLLVRRSGADGLRRGDLVVFDGTGSFDPWVERGPLRAAGARLGALLGLPGAPREYVKRVVGLPGERVTCCGAGGALLVDGEPLPEPYLAPGTAPSEVGFDVRLGPGQLWVLGDAREVAEDSRAHLGDPGGGVVPTARVLGRVVAVAWPPGRTALLGDRPDDRADVQGHAPGGLE